MFRTVRSAGMCCTGPSAERFVTAYSQEHLDVLREWYARRLSSMAFRRLQTGQ